MSPERAHKRRRGNVAPRPPSPLPSPLITLESNVYQVRSNEAKPLAVDHHNGDLYVAVRTPGAVIVDNSADIGRLDSGSLLRAETKLYLGFASPSEYSARQFASCLEMFHDKAAQHLSAFYNNFEMMQYAAQAKPSTHACLRLDFSDPTDWYFKGASETVDAVAAFINRVVDDAVKVFMQTYWAFLPPGSPSEDPLTPRLSSFLDWFARQSNTTLLIVVQELHRVLERPLQAAYWPGHAPPAIEDRLHLVRSLLLGPIWGHLSATDGAVGKLLMVGWTYLNFEMAYPRNMGDYPGLPFFRDLSSAASLQGFLPAQIRVVYSLPESAMTNEDLLSALNHCNVVSLIDRQMNAVYTKESVDSVFRPLFSDRSLLAAEADHASLYASYEKATREAAVGALYPLLLRHPPFRAKIEGLLKGEALPAPGLGPVFTIDELVDAEPSGDKLLVRLFMLGLLGRFQRKEENNSSIQYKLAGGCARALLKDLFDETEPNAYTAKLLRRPPTKTQNGSALPEGLDRYLDVGEFDICNQTEQSLSDLILNFFRPHEHWKQLPTGEPSLQMVLFHLLRAALVKKFGHTAFVIGLLRESWQRQPDRKVRRRYRQDVPPERWTRPSNICGDLVLIMTIDGQDYGIIYEVKWFDLEGTMNATHAYLYRKQAKAGHPGKLESQEVREREFLPEPRKDDLAWWKAAGIFLKEISSMAVYPPNWRILESAEKVKLRYPLRVEHLRAVFNKIADGWMKDSGYSYHGLKVAVGVAKDTVVQVAEYRDAGALGIADELVAGKQYIKVQELSRDEYLALRDDDGSAVGRPETPEAGKKDTPIFDNLNLSDLSSGQFGWADKRITDMGPGCTVIRAFAIVCVAGKLAFVKELEETRTLPRKIGIVDSSTRYEPDVDKMKPVEMNVVAGKMARDDNDAADKVYKRKKQYAAEMKT